jgi:prealbumin domain-containing protein
MSAFPFRPGRRLWLTVGTLAMVTAAVLFLVAAASAVLTGSPSSFESGNDPTLGVGNEVVNTPGNADWTTVIGPPKAANYVHLTDVSNSTGDDSFAPGQKQDTICPVSEAHKNPPKDDFTDVASFNEQAANGDVYLYGATLRFAPNGNASENIELKQGTSGLCPGTTTLFARTPGDKLLAIDYKGGGSAVEFHLLTWVASGACFVGNDTAPCWGATVGTLTPAVAEGGVSITDFNATQNPISGVPIVAGQFAEFGVNLSAAGIIPNTGSCAGFAQTVWESRSSGSSFVSSTKDISLENHTISSCASLSITKTGSDGGSQAGAVFTLYSGSGTGGPVVGTCTVNAAGNCVNDAAGSTFPPSFTNLSPGTYTVDETTVPSGYSKDPNMPQTFVLAANETKTITATDIKLVSHVTTASTPTGSVPIDGGSVLTSDSATVTVNATTWAGSVQFHLRGPIGSPLEASVDIGGPVAVSNSTPTVPSQTATVTAAGNYCWSAHVTFTNPAGVPPADDDGTNECFTVTPVTPMLATTAGPGVDLGNPITDTATLTGTANEPGTPVINPTTPGGPAGGTITFTLYGPNDCTTVAFTSDPVPVTGDGTYGPVSFTPTAPGTYHWAATYSGDPPNTNGTPHNLDCSDTGEDVVVTGVASSMTSAQSFIPNDSATISAPAGGDLVGTVHFAVYTGTDCDVSGTLIYQQDVSVNGASPQTVNTTNTTNSTTADNVSWLVSYDSTKKAQGSIPPTCFEKTALAIDNDGTITGPPPGP